MDNESSISFCQFLRHLEVWGWTTGIPNWYYYYVLNLVASWNLGANSSDMTNLSWIAMLASIFLCSLYSWLFVDTRETKHVESNKVGHTEISSKSQCIYLINSTRDEILVSQNISTEDGDSRILILYDVLYAPRIPWNLLFTFAFTGFGFNLSINDNFVNIYWEEVLYRCAQSIHRFIYIRYRWHLYHSSSVASHDDD